MTSPVPDPRPAPEVTRPEPSQALRERWTAVDGYIADRLIGNDAALAAALADSAAAGLPDIQVSPAQGKMLHLLARLRGARRILELGTLGGYSAIWLARALPPGGRLVTVELDPHHAAVAHRNLERAGLTDAVEIRIGPAAQHLADLRRDLQEPFDLVFIDADKPQIPAYLAACLPLVTIGSAIIVDNVVRRGGLADPGSSDAAVLGVQGLHDLLAATTCLSATTVQTVGCKGYDGFTLAVATGLPPGARKSAAMPVGTPRLQPGA